MIVKRLILKKILSNGTIAEFFLVKEEDSYEAALFFNGKHIPGPPLPQALDPPKGEVTHWMGNKPGVGLTQNDAERIIEEVECENKMLEHREKSGWDR